MRSGRAGHARFREPYGRSARVIKCVLRFESSQNCRARSAVRQRPRAAPGASGKVRTSQNAIAPVRTVPFSRYVPCAGGLRGRLEQVREHEAWFACRGVSFDAAGRERKSAAEAPVVAGSAWSGERENSGQGRGGANCWERLKNGIVAWENRCTLERSHFRVPRSQDEGSAAHKGVSSLRLVW
jgi:hypothetical protein